MKYVMIVTTVLGLLLAESVSAATGVDFAIDVYQDDPAAGAVQLFADTATVTQGVVSSGFLVSFSTDIELVMSDSAQAQFMVHLVTLGPPAKTYGRSFAVGYGLPARIEGIEGKGGVRYTMVLTPLVRRDVDKEACPFDHQKQGEFTIVPSANLDLHYAPNSFADFYLQTFKGMLEYHYREFQAYFSLSLPGKFTVFLCPCMAPSVLWDDRYGQMVDPTRSTVYALAANGMTSVDPFLVNHAAVLRAWGYAPPFLTEGTANYLMYMTYDMQRLLRERTVPPLGELLPTLAYRRTEGVLADRVSATFVQYLINGYGMNKFKDLYASADDVNLPERLAQVYGKSVAELDGEWRTYVDTSAVRFPQLVQETERAEAMFAYNRMAEYAEAMQSVAQSQVDSMFSVSNLKQAYFCLGNYYAATEAAGAHVRLHDASNNWMALGAYQMMNGLYEAGQENLRRGLAKDPLNGMLEFNLGLSYLYSGDTAKAESLLTAVISRPDPNTPQGESRVVVGELLLQRGTKAARERAQTYFAEAMQIFQGQLQTNRALPTAYLWFGAAALGMKDTDAARTSLETALFLETRPFYIGVINLWLGKVADVLGDHATAAEYFGRVISGGAAEYTQREARRYLEHPYSMK